MHATILRELHYAIEHSMMLGDAIGAYVYARLLARYALDRLTREPSIGRFDWGVSLS